MRCRQYISLPKPRCLLAHTWADIPCYQVYNMSEPFQERPFEEPPNHQLFQTATTHIREKLISQERHQRAQYHLFNTLFNLLTIAQVIIGAAITALGPLGDQHMLAITILGALNTSIAGLLALLKGRGLPQRLRRNMSELSKVIDHIEELKIQVKDHYVNANYGRLN